jgi:hypothetical protein
MLRMKQYICSNHEGYYFQASLPRDYWRKEEKFGVVFYLFPHVG